MLPGPTLVYQCPKCGRRITRESLLSGNTLGAIYYSDGKFFAPMLPEFPILTKCKQCNTILWLSKLEEIGNNESYFENSFDTTYADKAKFLSINDYFRALDEGLAETTEEEIFIRQRIWWSYNDRVRKGNKLFVNKNDERRWEMNCYKLINLLDYSDLNQRVMIAELKRNLGDFNGCIEVLESIKDKEFNYVKEKLLDECRKRNSLVIRLN